MALATYQVSLGQEPKEHTEPDERPVIFATTEVTASAAHAESTVIDRDALATSVPVGDGAEVLRDVVGVNLGRMGGHGLEPFIRGLSGPSVNILLDGATVHGGCPNRMDPSTAYAALETSDQVIVLRGVQTVRYGPGAPGGTVLFERHAPELGGETWRGEVATAVSSWSDAPELTVDASFGLGDWSVRAAAAWRDVDSYEDGDGTEVRSAAESRSGVVLVGWRPDARTKLEMSFERSETLDALFAGAGMDAPESTADIVRIEVARLGGAANPSRWSIEVFYDSVDHLMDNYSLRPLSAPMALEVPTTTSTWGVRGRLELPTFSFGVTTETATFDATRFAGPTPATIGAVQSIMWPDVTRRQIGAYVEGVRELSDHARLRYGARADYFSAAASRADEPTLGGDGPTPRQLWAMYTVGVDDSWSHWDGSGLLRLEHERGSWQLFAGLSRTVRVADATERFLAASSAMPAKRWVGNPGLEPARYHQLDLGAAWGRDRLGATLTLFAADVDGEILRDRARCQAGILRCDGATIYRNVQARRFGGELAGRLEISSLLMVTGGVAWVRAENATDHRPIAQTPPLSGHLQGVWSGRGWSVSTALQLADRQDRVDDDPAVGSGLDAGPTPSWFTVDLAGTLELGGGLDLSCGVANLLDRAYATHLNRASLFDPDPQRVNEPGRTVWVRLRWRGGAAGLLDSR